MIMAQQANPDADAAQEEQKLEFYINGKGQLIKIVQQERRGQTVAMHAIISFDLNQLPQANHSYTGPAAAVEGSTHLRTNLPRAKVPVRDGQSQGVSIPQVLLTLFSCLGFPLISEEKDTASREPGFHLLHSG